MWVSDVMLNIVFIDEVAKLFKEFTEFSHWLIGWDFNPGLTD